MSINTSQTPKSTVLSVTQGMYGGMCHGPQLCWGHHLANIESKTLALHAYYSIVKGKALAEKS